MYVYVRPFYCSYLNHYQFLLFFDGGACECLQANIVACLCQPRMSNLLSLNMLAENACFVTAKDRSPPAAGAKASFLRPIPPSLPPSLPPSPQSDTLDVFSEIAFGFLSRSFVRQTLRDRVNKIKAGPRQLLRFLRRSAVGVQWARDPGVEDEKWMAPIKSPEGPSRATHGLWTPSPQWSS